EPAPASTSSGPGGAVTAAYCSSFSDARKSIGGKPCGADEGVRAKSMAVERRRDDGRKKARAAQSESWSRGKPEQGVALFWEMRRPRRVWLRTRRGRRISKKEKAALAQEGFPASGFPFIGSYPGNPLPAHRSSVRHPV